MLSGLEKSFTVEDWQYKYSLNDLNWRSGIIAKHLVEGCALIWGEENVYFTGWKEHRDADGVPDWKRGAVAQWIDFPRGVYVSLPDGYKGKFPAPFKVPSTGLDFSIETEHPNLDRMIREGFEKLIASV